MRLSYARRDPCSERIDATVALAVLVGQILALEVEHAAQVTVQTSTHFDSIRHIDRKWRNNLIESDHEAMKRLLGYRQSFRSLRSAKATLTGIETIRTIKHGHIHQKHPGVQGEITFIASLFEVAA